MAADQSPDALCSAAFSDLKQFVKRPDAFGQASVYEMAETLWCVYLCRSDLFASFDIFLNECIRNVDFFRKQKGK